MNARRRNEHLSKEEIEYLYYVLLEEVEIQAWFAIAVSDLLGGEILISLQ